MSRRLRGLLVTVALLGLGLPAHAGGLTVGAGSSVDLGTGSLEVGQGDLDVSGTLAAGTVGITGARDVSILSGGVLNGESATIEVCGDWSNSGTFNAGTSQVDFVDGCQATAVVSGNSSFFGLSMSTDTGKTFQLTSGSTQTVASSLVLAGASGNLLELRSTTGGSEAFLNVQGTSSGTFVDVEDVDAGPGNTVPLDGNSAIGSNATNFVIGGLVPVLTPLGLLALAAGLVWRGRRALVSRA